MAPCRYPRRRCGQLPRGARRRIFLISAGMTCEEEGSKLSPGPYRFTGIRWMTSNAYLARYVWPWTSGIFLDGCGSAADRPTGSQAENLAFSQRPPTGAIDGVDHKVRPFVDRGPIDSVMGGHDHDDVGASED